MLSHVQAGEAVVLGLMSGSSLDGLDLCLARFGYGPTRPWSYQILKSRTIPYDEALQERLRRAPMAARQELLDLDVDLGRRWAHEINRLLQDPPPSGPHDAPCLVASHGHTIDHRPKRGYTYQIGNPAWLHALTGLPVVHDFRSADVALGGQGAPLVPMGDALLFGDYNACLNLGESPTFLGKNKVFARPLISLFAIPPSIVLLRGPACPWTGTGCFLKKAA